MGALGNKWNHSAIESLLICIMNESFGKRNLDDSTSKGKHHVQQLIVIVCLNKIIC